MYPSRRSFLYRRLDCLVCSAYYMRNPYRIGGILATSSEVRWGGVFFLSNPWHKYETYLIRNVCSCLIGTG